MGFWLSDEGRVGCLPMAAQSASVSRWPPSLGVAVEDRQQIIQSLIHPLEVTDVAPVDGLRVVAEVIVGQLLQPGQLGVDGCGAGEVGVDGCGLGGHGGLRVDG